MFVCTGASRKPCFATVIAVVLLCRAPLAARPTTSGPRCLCRPRRLATTVPARPAASQRTAQQAATTWQRSAKVHCKAALQGLVTANTPGDSDGSDAASAPWRPESSNCLQHSAHARCVPVCQLPSVGCLALLALGPAKALLLSDRHMQNPVADCPWQLPACSLCPAEWEAAAANVPSSTRVVIIRTGIVLARDGGVLARMLPIFELFAGGSPVVGECPGCSHDLLRPIGHGCLTRLMLQRWQLSSAAVLRSVRRGAPQPAHCHLAAAGLASWSSISWRQQQHGLGPNM